MTTIYLFCIQHEISKSIVYLEECLLNSHKLCGTCVTLDRVKQKSHSKVNTLFNQLKPMGLH